MLTFPYVSRVLGVENIGICNFVDSIINYFVLFSTMGIATLGIREIAGARNNKTQMSRTFSALFIINMIATIFVALVLLLAIHVVPTFHQHANMLYIGLSKLCGQLFLIEWFYKGLEDFKYITKRSIAVKTIYVLLIFILIKSPDDYVLYFTLTCIMWVANAVFNCIYARRFTSFSVDFNYIIRYIKPFFILGVYNILTSMYTSFNVAFLGMTNTVNEVGYYTTSTKLLTLILSIYTAFTGVMVPKMSSLVSSSKIGEFNGLIAKSLDALLFFSIPVIILCIITAPEIIRLLAGVGYEGSILPFIIIMPLVFIIGYEQILAYQILMPLKKDNIILFNSAIGAIVGIVANIILVPSFGGIGSAFVWFFSEVSVLVVCQIWVTKLLKLAFPYGKLFKNFVYYLPILIILICIEPLQINYLSKLLIDSCIMFTYFVVLNVFILKNELIKNLFNSCLKRI